MTSCPSFMHMATCLHFLLRHSYWISICLTGDLKAPQYAYYPVTAVNMTFWLWTGRDVLDSPQEEYLTFLQKNSIVHFYVQQLHRIFKRYTGFLKSSQPYHIVFG